jgi:hypothetical protein
MNHLTYICNFIFNFSFHFLFRQFCKLALRHHQKAVFVFFFFSRTKGVKRFFVEVGNVD